MIDDSRLRVFLAVAETGSFTRAAEMLGISQPAVSQNIAELENNIGARLFDRSRHSVSLSAKGDLFMLYARKIAYWYDAAEKMFGKAVGRSHVREIRISASADLASCILPEVISAVRTMNPELKFIVSGQDGDRTDGCDMIFTSCLYSGELDFTGAQDDVIAVSEACIVVSASSPAAFGKVSSLSGLDPGSVAFWSLPGPSQQVLPPDVLPLVGVESSSLEVVKKCALGSSGMAGILPRYAVREEIADGRLSVLPQQKPFYAMAARLTVSGEFGRTSLSRFLTHQLRESFSW